MNFIVFPSTSSAVASRTRRKQVQGNTKKVANFKNEGARVRARGVGMKDAMDIDTRSWRWIYVTDVSRQKR